MTLENHPCECLDPSKVHEVMAWVGEDESGEEGIIPIVTRLGLLPALGADIERVMSYRPYVEAVVKERRKPATLRRFHYTGDIETIEPPTTLSRDKLWLP